MNKRNKKNFSGIILISFFICVFLNCMNGLAMSVRMDSEIKNKKIIKEKANSGSYIKSFPDDFGYYWDDSDYNPVFPPIPLFPIDLPQWEFTNIQGIDDGTIGPYDIGFDFRYYGNIYNKFWIGTNGHISFTDRLPMTNPYFIVPFSQKPNTTLCPLAGDLTFKPAGIGHLYLYSNKIDTMIVYWKNVPEWSAIHPGYDPETSHNFQVMLTKADSTITFIYGKQKGRFDQTGYIENVVGIENESGQIGLQYLMDDYPPSNIVHDSLSIRFYPPEDPEAVYDLGIYALMNESSAAEFFYNPDTVAIKCVLWNYGTRAAKLFKVNSKVKSRGNSIVYDKDVNIDIIWPGKYKIVTFSPTWVVSDTGQYAITIKSAWTDSFPENDSLACKVSSVNYPGWLIYDDGIAETSRFYESGETGFANCFSPPKTNIKILEAKLYFIQNYPMEFKGQNKRLTIWDNDGLNGEPGSIIYSKEFSSVLGWNTFDLSSEEIIIESDSFYVGYTQLAKDSEGIGFDMNYLLSRRGWEFTGTWNVDRMQNYGNLMIRVKIRLNPEDAGDEKKIPFPGYNIPVLFPNYPNPFNPMTNIKFYVPEFQKVELAVYDVEGRIIKNIIDGILPPGFHEFRWKGENNTGLNVVSGIYYLRLLSDGFCDSKKLLLVK